MNYKALRYLLHIACFATTLSSQTAEAINHISENIQSWTSQGSYGTWTQSIAAGTVNMVQCIVTPGAAASGTGSMGYVQMQASAGTLTLPSVNTVGTVTVTIHAGAEGRTLKLQKNVNGAGWTDVTTWTGIGTTGATFTYDVNDPSANIALRLATPSAAVYVHDIIVTDYSTEDPNLVVPSSLAFGTLVPGATATQVLSLANSGASNTLHLISLSPASGDTGKFSVGAVPATLAPGANAGVSVVYVPGAETGVFHSAIFNLLTDDPSTPTNPVTFSGATVGAALTVSNIQYSLSGASPQAGNRVTVSGIATYADPYGYAISDASGGPWSGIFVADVLHRPDPGDRVYLEGLVQESGAFTILTNVADYSVTSTGQAVPLTTIKGNQLATEAYEGVLVSITNITVRNTNYNNGRVYWQAGDSTASFLVGTRVPYRYVWVSNATLTAIQGLAFTNFISPRFDADFAGRPVYEYALRGLVMTPDGPRTNWTVHVRDDVIVAVTNVAIAGVTNVNTGGIIFPGLLDVHNHPAYNSFPTLMFNNFPYGHRDEWGEYDAEYDDWKTKRTTLRGLAAVSDSSTDVITKYGECLELMAGCIAIQGQSNADPEHSHPVVILKNIEQFPARTWADIFPWTSTAAERSNLLAKIEGGAVNASMIHLCEGTDTTARAQFAAWRDWGMLDETTAIIHGAALNAADFAQMAAAGAKLIWSPMSNMKLYAGTANVKAARDAGVVVGLSPDWTPSGCFNMLEELGYAWYLNQTIFSNAFTARDMCDMVTINNAKCAGLDDHYGKIAVGYNAGLAVIEGDPADPYMSLISARPPNVLLTIVDGTPRYGEPSLMTALGVAGESVDVRGRAKKFNIAVVHPFLDYSSRTFTQLRSSLQTGHASLTTLNELDSEELQMLDLSLLQGDGGDDIPPFRADNPISAAPGTAVYDLSTNLVLAFRYQDFWDNDTFITSLTHTISIVPARYSNLVLQTIATNRANTPASQTVNFTVGFQDMHTNYIFAFATRDGRGNVRTTYTTNSFRLAFHTGGDSDRDGLPNEWEISYFGSFTSAVATANSDTDWMNNLEEYVAVTIPNNSDSVLSEGIETMVAAVGTLDIESPVPTSAGRVYDVWRTTNLLGNAVWTPMNLNVPGLANSNAVILRVTNTAPSAIYRTGVKIPD